MLGESTRIGKIVPMPRVLLRPPSFADMDEFLSLRIRSRAFHEPWEPAPAEGQDRVSEQAFARYMEYVDDPRIERLFVCSAEDGSIRGAIHLSEIVRGAFQSAYMGYWVDVDAAGQGWMRAGLRLALHHTFESVGLHRVEANIRPENLPSIALVRGAGFRREGFSPRYLEIDGAWRDHERWALVVEDWRASASQPAHSSG